MLFEQSLTPKTLKKLTFKYQVDTIFVYLRREVLPVDSTDYFYKDIRRNDK